MQDIYGYKLDRALEILNTQQLNKKISWTITESREKTIHNENQEIRVIGSQETDQEIVLIVAYF